jgi:hypothetical protein
VRRGALALAVVALSGCQTTAEKSARIEREAKRRSLAVQNGLKTTRPSREVRVTATTVLHGSEGAVAVVELRNTSSHALRSVPLALTVTGAGGRTVYENSGAGLEAALVSVPVLAPHATFAWVDDQIPAAGSPSAARAGVGEAPALTGAIPQIAVAGVHPIEDPSNGMGAAGTVSNRSAVAQVNLVLFALARRSGRIVAAGRAVLPELAAGAQLPFQVFFVGDPGRARIQVSAPPSRTG